MTVDDLPPDARPPTLRESAVPDSLWSFIRMTELYGIGDDGYRRDIVESLSPGEAQILPDAVNRASHERLWEWFSGPESKRSPPTPEYVAFTCLTMAYDYAKALFGGEDAV